MRLQARLLASAYRAWMDWSQGRRGLRKRLLPALARLRNRELAAAHASWRQAAVALKGKRLLGLKVLLSLYGFVGARRCEASLRHGSCCTYRAGVHPSPCLPLQAVYCLNNMTLRRALNGWLFSHAAHAHKQELLHVAVGKLQHRELAMVRARVTSRVFSLSHFECAARGEPEPSKHASNFVSSRAP